MSTLTFVRPSTSLMALAKLIVYGPKSKYFTVSEKLIAFRQKKSKDSQMQIINDKESSQIIQRLLNYKQRKINEHIVHLATIKSAHKLA